MSLLQSRTRAARQGFGRPVRRVEDRRLLTGRGCYSDDFSLPGQVYASFVRSPHAHTRIVRIDTDGRVRLVGEAVAMVIAETPGAARDGAEAVRVDYAPLPVVTRAREAEAPGAPLVWDEAGSNVCVDSDTGDAAATHAAFGRAAYIVRLETQVNRVTGVPMEPR